MYNLNNSFNLTVLQEQIRMKTIDKHERVTRAYDIK